jgi:exosome complex component RRP40
MMERREEELLVLPGDDLTAIIKGATEKVASRVAYGPGLRQEDGRVKAVKCGLLRFREKPNLFWVDSHQKRYIPIKGERVLGIVTGKGSLTARVDIGANELATLSLLAFEGATKRNRPQIKVGDLVFARIVTGGRDIEAELVCVTSRGKKEGMGVLPESGFMITVPIDVVRKILSPECPLLPSLGSKFRFEIAAGINGRIWVKAKTVAITLLICNTISQVEHMNADQLVSLCNNISHSFEVYERKK